MVNGIWRPVWAGFILFGLFLTAALPARADLAEEAFQAGDYQTARQEWQDAAKDGDAFAQYNLGYLYDLGLGVAADKGKAAKWYRLAAEQNHSPALFNLAAMFVNGEGVRQDYVLAYMLFDLAAAEDADARFERDDLANYMAPVEIARGSRLAREARRGALQKYLRRALAGAFSGGETTAEWSIWTPRELTALVQKTLAELGYDPGPADGVAGGRTRTAVAAFRKDRGLAAEGAIDEALLDDLYAAFDARLASETLPYDQGRFWLVESPSGETSYLLGTMHSADLRIVNLPKPISKAFARSETVALELDLYKEINPEIIQAAYLDALVIKDGRSLRSILGRDLYADVSAALRPYGIDSEVLSYLKPWGVYHFLTQVPESQVRGEAGGPFLDLWLAQQAGHLGKTVVGLETLDEQLGIFSGLSEKDQVALVRALIVYPVDEGLSLEEMKTLYLAGDLRGIFHRTFEPMRRLGPKAMLTVIERLLDNRNVIMVERMRPLLDKGKAFVAVGAAHLPGEQGVLNLLVEQGYKVSPVAES